MSKARLLCSSLLISAAMGAPAFAQVVANDAQSDTTVVSGVVITGTRLQLPDYVSVAPTVTASSEQIEASGQTNLTEFLQDVPALVGSLDDASGSDTSTPFYAGINLPNLHNLGSSRTLTLVNGRRHIASAPGTAAVDTYSIPVDLIDRVEVITGGASAVYGADAVSGVLNFILKDNYQGVTARTEYGFTEEGGGGTTFVSVLAGRNFLDDRANLVFEAEYNDRQDIKFNDRPYTRVGRRYTLFDNPADTGPDDGIPEQIPTNNLTYYDTSLGGSIYTGYDQFDPTIGPALYGNGSPFIHGTNFGGFISIGGSGSSLDLYNDDLISGVERYALNLNGHFDITPRIRLFEELKYTHSISDFRAQPSYDYALFIPADNPYVPQAAIDQALTNTYSIYDYTDYFLGEDGFFVARDNFDLGRQEYNNTNETFRAVFGIDAAITDHIDFEASYVYGKARQRVDASNVRINERFYAATDVVDDGSGHIVCRSDLDPNAIPVGDFFAQDPFDPSTWGTTFTPGPNSGCTPVDIFGEGAFSQAAKDWINTNIVDRASIDQQVLTAYVSGDTTDWFSLPAGPISFVAGGEYRRESSDYEPDDLEILADDLEYPLTYAGRAVVTKGSFNVKELFGELNFPLIKDKPFFKNVNLRGAYRYSDYSTAGKTNTWNASFNWQVNDSVMFRYTRARAVRAPNINELFLGYSTTYNTIVDPCSSDNILDAENYDLVVANCEADLNPLGLTVGPDDATDYTDSSSEATRGFISGNLSLTPEAADTETVGVVFTPTFVPGLSISVDWYDITIDNVIVALSAQSIVSNCYELPRPNDYCDLIERADSGPFIGRISSFSQLPQNIGTRHTSGTDVTVNYALDPKRFGIEQDIGTFNIRFVGNLLDSLVTIDSSTSAPTYDDGDAYAPDFQGNLDLTWDYHNFQVNYGLSYWSPTRRISRTTRVSNPEIVDPSLYNYSAHQVHDIQIAYTYKDKYEVYGGINNFTNQLPELQDFIYPVTPVGRFFYMGLKVDY